MMPFASNYCSSITIHPLLDISALPKPTNCSHATITSPACFLSSNPTFPPATYAPVEKLPVMLNTVSYPHCQFPPVPGNLFHVTLSPICHHQKVSFLSLSLLIDYQRCITSLFYYNNLMPSCIN